MMTAHAEHGRPQRSLARLADCGGGGDKRTREKSNLLHETFSKLEALFTVVLVCFAQRIGTNI